MWRRAGHSFDHYRPTADVDVCAPLVVVDAEAVVDPRDDAAAPQAGEVGRRKADGDDGRAAVRRRA